MTALHAARLCRSFSTPTGAVKLDRGAQATPGRRKYTIAPTSYVAQAAEFLNCRLTRQARDISLDHPNGPLLSDTEHHAGIAHLRAKDRIDVAIFRCPASRRHP